jgi:hypothetical protein
MEETLWWRRIGEGISRDRTFLGKNNQKMMMKKRSKSLKTI